MFGGQSGGMLSFEGGEFGCLGGDGGLEVLEFGIVGGVRGRAGAGSFA